MRYYNTGKFLHQVGRNKDSGEMIESIKDLAPTGHPIGTAIVNFPGHDFKKVVPAGAPVDIPDDISTETVKSHCPSLVSEADWAAVNPAPAKAGKKEQ